MSLANTQQQQIRQLISSPQWGAFELMAKEICDKIRDDTVLRETEWETLKATLLREGKILGIQDLIKEAYRNAEASLQPHV